MDIDGRQSHIIVEKCQNKDQKSCCKFLFHMLYLILSQALILLVLPIVTFPVRDSKQIPFGHRIFTISAGKKKRGKPSQTSLFRLSSCMFQYHFLNLLLRWHVPQSLFPEYQKVPAHNGRTHKRTHRFLLSWNEGLWSNRR